MKPDTTLVLGDFEFARFEVPEKIPFGGEQRITVHELVGGLRVVDAMGATPVPIEWSGFFVGSAALERSRYLDGLRKAGRPLNLTWSAFAFSVVIKSLNCDFERFYRVPYRISCEVVGDMTDPVLSVSTLSLDDSIMADAVEAARLAQLADAQNRVRLGLEANAPLPENVALAPLLAVLDAAIAAVSGFAGAVQGTINRVLQPIAAIRSRVGILVRAVNGTIQNVSTLGGIFPNNPIAQQSSNLLSQLNALDQSATLINLDRVLGRMQANIGTINTGVKQLPVAGGNLYSIASKEYGTPMAWTAIATANELSDPQIAGITTLELPSRADAKSAASRNSSGASTAGGVQSGGVLAQILE